MSSIEVYVYIKEKIELDGNSPILLKDVADIWCSDGDSSQIEDLPLGFFKDIEYQRLSCLDAAKVIKKHLPNSHIHLLGSPEIWIVKKAIKARQNSIMLYLKLTVISIVLFVGSSMAVMNFHADVDMPTVHKKVYHFITHPFLNRK
jgi:stage V sporulation protein AA